ARRRPGALVGAAPRLEDAYPAVPAAGGVASDEVGAGASTRGAILFFLTRPLDVAEEVKGGQDAHTPPQLVGDRRPADVRLEKDARGGTQRRLLRDGDHLPDHHVPGRQLEERFRCLHDTLLPPAR